MRKCLRARARSSGLAKESFCSMGFLNGEMDFLNVRSMLVGVGEAMAREEMGTPEVEGEILFLCWRFPFDLICKVWTNGGWSQCGRD